MRQSPYLTHDEAAAYLRLSPWTLYHLVLADKGPLHRKNPGTKGKLTYHIDDLDNWCHQRKRRNTK